MKTLNLFFILSIVLITGCSSGPIKSTLSSSDKPFHPSINKMFLGEELVRVPIKGFSWVETLSSQEIVLWHGTRRAWWMKLDGPCAWLNNSPLLQLTSKDGFTYGKFDEIKSKRKMERNCLIMDVRKISVEDWKKERLTK